MPNQYTKEIWGGKGKQHKRKRRVYRAKSVLEAVEYGLAFRPASHDSPTNEMPGSHERIGVYIRRVQDGLELFHPLDATFFDD